MTKIVTGFGLQGFFWDEQVLGKDKKIKERLEAGNEWSDFPKANQQIM